MSEWRKKIMIYLVLAVLASTMVSVVMRLST